MLTGTAAANQAGPAITLSYMLAGLACAFAALCYAEFASMIPIAGSAYTYAYATLGEIFAWMIGWDLILEYAVGSMTVAIGWSGYFQRILAGFGITLPVWMSRRPRHDARRGHQPAGDRDRARCITVLLVIGIRESARFNAVMVAIKLAAVLFFIVAGFRFVKPENWSPFAPYGWSGIMAAAAVVFFAYIGFDAVSTTAEEAKNPQPRPADRHHRLARHLHGPLHRRGRRPHRHRAGHALPHVEAALPGTPIVPLGRARRSSTRRWPTRCT